MLHAICYDVLRKLGLGRSRIHGLIARQLVAYYLYPAVLAMVISGRMILYSAGFSFGRWGAAAPLSVFGKSVALYFGIYLVYFAVTYIGFQRSVEQLG